MKIAYIEDDEIQLKPICGWLKEAGYQCEGYTTSEGFLREARHNVNYDLLLIDWMLPDMSGLELLRVLRKQLGVTIPVMFVTQRADEEDIVTALHDGADDYLVKPARRRELLARIDALSRRRNRFQAKPSRQQFGPFELDMHSRQLRKQGQLLVLTQKEFTLAHFLLNNLGQLITRQELLEKVWRQSPNINTRTVDTHISRLRKKLDLTPEFGWQLTAVYQYGYRLDWLENDYA